MRPETFAAYRPGKTLHQFHEVLREAAQPLPESTGPRRFDSLSARISWAAIAALAVAFAPHAIGYLQ